MSDKPNACSEEIDRAIRVLARLERELGRMTGTTGRLMGELADALASARELAEETEGGDGDE